MKMTRREMAPLRYMMRPIHDEKGQTIRHEIIVVPDVQMDNFMRVASIVDDRVFYIENLDFAGRPGQRVKVIAGDFAGVEGIIKRVKKNKRVVVQIEHVAAVAIAFLPSAFLEPIK
jgi:transcription antitermination factor NusG